MPQRPARAILTFNEYILRQEYPASGYIGKGSWKLLFVHSTHHFIWYFVDANLQIIRPFVHRNRHSAGHLHRPHHAWGVDSGDVSCVGFIDRLAGSDEILLMVDSWTERYSRTQALGVQSPVHLSLGRDSLPLPEPRVYATAHEHARRARVDEVAGEARPVARGEQARDGGHQVAVHLDRHRVGPLSPTLMVIYHWVDNLIEISLRESPLNLIPINIIFR